MRALLGNRSIVRSTLICLLLASAVLACASTGHAQAREDKHTRKIHRKLDRYPAGSYLHLILRNSPDSYGALGAVSDASFTFKSAESNATATIAYSDVSRIKTDREAIGEGTAPRHYFRTRTYVIAGVLAAGAAVAAVEVR